MQRQYTVQAQLPIRPYPWLHPKMSVVRCVCSVALPTPSIRLVAPCFFGLVTCVLVPLLQQLAGSFAQVVVGFCKFWHGRRVGTWQRTWHGHGGFDLLQFFAITGAGLTLENPEGFISVTRGDAGGRSPILRYIYPMLRLLTSHNLKPRGWSSLSLSHPWSHPRSADAA